jgi:DNA replication protein DnaC
MQKLGSFISNRMPHLFVVRSELKGKVEPLDSYFEPCPHCKRENGMAVWTYLENGQTKRHTPARFCTVCQNGISKVSHARPEMMAKKWFHITENDPSGFKNYESTNKATEKALKDAKEYIRKMLKGDMMINLLLMGSTGTGKSHLAKAIAKTAKEKGLKVAYIEAVELFNLIKTTFGHERHNEMLYNDYKSFDLVVIDDVGLETKKQGEVTWSVTEWTKLINAREGKATVFTTNFDDAALAEVVGQRAFSRMYTNTKFIDLFTDDYRKKLQV